MPKLTKSSMIIPSYDPYNWYWIVGSDTTRVFSSKVANYVLLTDATYVAWLAAGNIPTKIGSEQELYDVLVAAGMDPPDVLTDASDVTTISLWALKAALSAFTGGDKEAAYTTWITANKSSNRNMFFQWQIGSVVSQSSALLTSIQTRANITAANMKLILQDAKKRANKQSGVI